jgi:hypothetical protein
MPTISKPTKGIITVIAIATALGVALSFWFSWSGLIPLAASFGGMVVFLGLWIEKEADKVEKGEHLSNFIGDKRRIKIQSEVGWWILMIGILIEVMTGAGLAAYDVYENGKNARNAAKNSPFNQPIADVSAMASFVIKPNNIKEIDAKEWSGGGISHDAYLILCDSNNPSQTRPLTGYNVLVADNFSKMLFGAPSPTAWEYIMRFRLEDFITTPIIRTNLIAIQKRINNAT